MSYFILVILGAILFFAPYQRGLFFDSDFYLIAFVILVSFLVWMIAAYIKKRRISGIYLIIFLIPFMYALAFLTAESPAFNFDNLFRWLAYACFLVMLIEVRKEKHVNNWLPYVFQITGIALALFSYFGYLGWIDYKDIIVSDRLSGPFQYPNTFAAVMGAYWLYSLIITARNAGSIISKIIHSGSLVLFGTTFLLAFSRGALIVLPFAWLLGLILLRTKGQLMFILYTAISALLSLGAMVMSDGAEWLALLVLLAASAMPSVIQMFLLRRSDVGAPAFKNPHLEKYSRWGIPTAILFVGILLVLDLLNQGAVYRVLPPALQEQVSTINLETGSALGRMGMYDDALDISLDYPWLGAGGDGWRILYTQYQTEPYLSNEIHNGYLETLLNIGYIGFAVFLIVFGILIVGMFMRRSRSGDILELFSVSAMISAVSILFMHAFLDFDFSYGSYWFFILWIIAMAVPADGEIFRGSKIQRLASEKFMLAVKIGVVLFVLVGAVFNIRVYAASTEVKIHNQMTLDTVIKRYESAFRLNPYNVTYGINLANLYLQNYAFTNNESMKQLAIDTVERVISLEPNNSKVLYAAGEMYSRWQDWDQALEYMDMAIAKEPFDVRLYNGTIPLKQQLGAIHEAVDPDKSERYYQASIADYELYAGWYEKFKDVRLPDKRDITLSKQAILAAARAYAGMGKAEESLALLDRYNPVIDDGIIDDESGQVLDDSFHIMSFAEMINQYSDRIVIMSVKGKAVRKLPDDVKQLLTNMGSAIDTLTENGSYIGVIAQGQIIQEMISPGEAVRLTNDNANAKLLETIGSHRLNVYSVGQDDDAISSIVVDGTEYSYDKRGFNITVFDADMKLVGNVYFDTHVSDVRVMKN